MELLEPETDCKDPNLKNSQIHSEYCNYVRTIFLLQ